MFPIARNRRMRLSKPLRDLIFETNLKKSHLIAPFFVIPGSNKRVSIDLLSGHYQHSPDLIVSQVRRLYELGYRNFIIFGIPEYKDEVGSASCLPTNPAQEAISLIKKEFDDTVVMADVCLCSYTSHGHCGLMKEGIVDNDSTLDAISQMSVSLASSGADILAPSGMMDGAVMHIRQALDKASFYDKAIMGYSAKYASSLYGPFRQAADSAPAFGDRKSYQMSLGNVNEALREVAADLEEGADLIMIKPAGFYLDVITKVKQGFNAPLGAYQVSGEYAMIKAAGNAGIGDVKNLLLESLLSIKRSGADMIFTYACEELADMIPA